MPVTVYHNRRCNTFAEDTGPAAREERSRDEGSPPSNSHSPGTSTGAPLSLIKNTRNVAGLVLLAFRSTT